MIRCLAQTDRDHQAGGLQRVSVEDAMSMAMLRLGPFRWSAATPGQAVWFGRLLLVGIVVVRACGGLARVVSPRKAAL